MGLTEYMESEPRGVALSEVLCMFSRHNLCLLYVTINFYKRSLIVIFGPNLFWIADKSGTCAIITRNLQMFFYNKESIKFLNE